MGEKEAAAAVERTISMAEAAKRLSLARITVERHCRAGILPSIKVGTRRLVPVEALEQVLAGTWTPEQGPVLESPMGRFQGRRRSDGRT